MIKAAVLGSPIEHSLSPLLHNRAYEILGIPASYHAIDLTPDSALDFFERALQEDWTGFSLTMPLKESIFDLVSDIEFLIEPIALRMRSANTLIKEGSRYSAFSTDRTGFQRLLAPISRERVAIIGGGGTARAALAAIDSEGVEIDFLLRSPHRALTLSTIAVHSTVNFYTMDHSLDGYDLVISTVPTGASDAIAKNLNFKIPCLFEVLYKPFPTPLLAKARSLGVHTFDGMDLLVEQALDQIAAFADRSFDYDEMRRELQIVGRRALI